MEAKWDTVTNRSRRESFFTVAASTQKTDCSATVDSFAVPGQYEGPYAEDFSILERRTNLGHSVPVLKASGGDFFDKTVENARHAVADHHKLLSENIAELVP